MDEQRFLSLARQVMTLPTAPFHEHFAMEAVTQFAAARPGIQLRRDPFGNLLLHYNPKKSRRRPYLIATAHLDHPGLGFPRRLSTREFFFERLGGVDLGLALGSRVRIYDPRCPSGQRARGGRITAHLPAEGERPEGFVVEVNSGTRLGGQCFAMWDLAPLRQRGHRLYGRACDDLAGATVGLAFLDALFRRGSPARAGLLLTRAEEAGFGGMLAAIRHHCLDSEALYLNIECSSISAGAILGDGPVIRVGDRWWVFDPRVSGGLVALAQELAEADPQLRFQRKLMDGGICEATVLTSAGYRTGAVALPLGNYHNTGEDRLAPEVIHLGDALGLVHLLVHLALQPRGLERAFVAAAEKLDQAMAQRYERTAGRLKETLFCKEER